MVLVSGAVQPDHEIVYQRGSLEMQAPGLGIELPGAALDEPDIFEAINGQIHPAAETLENRARRLGVTPGRLEDFDIIESKIPLGWNYLRIAHEVGKSEQAVRSDILKMWKLGEQEFPHTYQRREENIAKRKMT